MKTENKIKIMIRLTSGNQFGIDENEIEEIIKNRKNYSNLEIKGIQYFSGTQKISLKNIKKEIYPPTAIFEKSIARQEKKWYIYIVKIIYKRFYRRINAFVVVGSDIKDHCFGWIVIQECFQPRHKLFVVDISVMRDT